MSLCTPCAPISLLCKNSQKYSKALTTLGRKDTSSPKTHVLSWNQTQYFDNFKPLGLESMVPTEDKWVILKKAHGFRVILLPEKHGWPSLWHQQNLLSGLSLTSTPGSLPDFLSVFSSLSAELYREIHIQGWCRGSSSREVWKQGRTCSVWLLESVSKLSVVSGKCRTTLTSFNWRWQCSTVLICQGQETPRYCSLLREQEADGGGLKNPYPLPSTSQLQQMAPRMPSVKCLFSFSMWSHVSTLGIQL